MNTTAPAAIARPLYATTDEHTLGYVTLKNGQTRPAVSGPRNGDHIGETYLHVSDSRGRNLKVSADVAATYTVVGPQCNGHDVAAAHADALAEDAARTAAADAELDTTVIAGDLRAAYELTLNDDADIARQYDAVRGVILRAAHDAALDENIREHRPTRYYTLDDISTLAGFTLTHAAAVLAEVTGTTPDAILTRRARFPQALVQYVMPILKAQRRLGLV